MIVGGQAYRFGLSRTLLPAEAVRQNTGVTFSYLPHFSFSLYQMLITTDDH
jgi:hypothetical protein